MITRPYTKIDTAFLQNPNISRKTKGLVAEIKSRGPGWETFVTGLVSSGPEGKDAIMTMIKEAEKFGHMGEEKQQRDEHGKWSKQLYWASDTPREPQRENPVTEPQPEKPFTDNPVTDEMFDNQRVNPQWENPATARQEDFPCTGNLPLERKEKNKEKRKVKVPPQVASAIAEWNKLAKRTPLSEVIKITPRRIKACQSIIEEFDGLDDWRRALNIIEGSAFLCGENDRSWKPIFDWLCKPDNITKVLEGTYGNGRARTYDDADLTDDMWHSQIKTWEDFGHWPPEYGNPPGNTGCKVPNHILEERGYG